MTNAMLARWWMILTGVILIAVGILGYVPNPIVGQSGLVATDGLHNAVHVLTGLVALGIVALFPNRIAEGTIAFGVLYGVVFVVTLVSPTLFGLFAVPVNSIDHVIHIALALASIGIGLLARASEPAVAR